MNKIKYKTYKKVTISIVNSTSCPATFQNGILDANFRKQIHNDEYIVLNKDIPTHGQNWATEQIFNAVGTEKPVDKDLSFYRHKKITLPRDKFSLLKDKLNWSVTRDIENADYHVISDKLLSSIIQTCWTSEYLAGKEYLKFIESCNSFTSTKAKNDLASHYIGDDYIYTINSYWYHSSPVGSAKANQADLVMDKFNSAYRHIADTINYTIDDGTILFKKSTYLLKDEKAFVQFLNPTSKYVLDTYLVDLCNLDNPILTGADFEMIKNLLMSDNRDDAAMALNVLANCNIYKSLDVVSYFYVFYWSWMKDSSSWNSINVKSMRKVLEPLDTIAGYSHSSSYGYDQIVKFLAKNNSLSEFIFKKIINRIVNKYTSAFFSNDSTVFKIPEIELKDKWAESLLFLPVVLDNVVEPDIKQEDLPF